MKIVYACYPGYFSLLFLNLALRKRKLPIKTLLISTKPLKMRSKDIGEIKSTWDLISIYGPRYAAFCVVLKSVLKHSLNVLKWFSTAEYASETLWLFDRIAKEYNLNVIKSEDFNSQATRDMLATQDYDVLLSCFCNQIFKNETLALARKQV